VRRTSGVQARLTPDERALRARGNREHDMKRILVPCDGSESALRAVRHAAADAASAASACEVQLIHVIEPMTPIALSDAFSAQWLDERFPPQAAQALQPAAAILDGAGARYTLHCRFGAPALEIAAHAREAGCDAIVMGTRGRGALAKLVIGSVATQVLHLADVPVTLVK
jgi:nucleotide-binding universal stress UspA family protein